MKKSSISQKSAIFFEIVKIGISYIDINVYFLR